MADRQTGRDTAVLEREASAGPKRPQSAEGAQDRPESKERPDARPEKKPGDGDQTAATNSEAGEEKERSDDDSEAKKPMKPILKIVLIVAGGIILLAVTAYGLFWWFRGSYYQSTNDSYLQVDQVDIAPRISGYVDDVLVSDNQTVEAGQPLIRISDRNYRARLEKDRAQMAEAEANIIESQAQLHQQQAQIEDSVAQLSQSEAQARQYLASTQYNDLQANRYRPLVIAGAETGEKLAGYVSSAQQARAQQDAANAQSASNRAKIEYARRQTGIYLAQGLSGQAKLKQGQAQLAADQVDADATVVVSKVAGRVGDRTVRVGQYLQAGTQIMTIVPVQAMYLKANIKETQIKLMRVGQPASIKVDALGGMEIHGVVESFSPGTGAQFSLIPTDNATGNFTKITQRVPVRVRIDAGPEARKVLVPGLSATVKVDTYGAKDALKADTAETRDTSGQRRAQARRENAQGQSRHDAGAGHA